LPRDWLGVEGISYLMYDDPLLLEEMLDWLSSYFIELYRPVVARVSFDFAYVFEDCCGKSGPLFSPAMYRRHFDRYYRRLIDFYHGAGIRHVLLDSDGMGGELASCWVESGFNILFPIEVGTWGADPCAFRARFGKGLRLVGGVDKRVLTQGEDAVRAHLQRLRGLARDGGYLPLPDHRIQPEVSLAQMRQYVRLFKEVFWA
jgi:uroporphyrinogen-III decarboxylase